jgi:lipid-A-disaccharide synthase
MTYDLFIFAGELSGDKHGASLIKELQQLNPSLKICVVGGPNMRTKHVDVFMHTEKFLVMGFIDVFLNLPQIIYHFFKIKKFILKNNPKAVVFIDYPGFTLAMEKALRKHHFKGKIIHYICPTVWAWKKKRVFSMSKTLDLLLCILPFEPKYFENLPIKTVYVGHPLTQDIKLSIQPKENIIGLFPGSRKETIKRNLPIQIKAVEALMENHPDFQCAISIAHPKFLPIIKKMIKNKNFFTFPAEKNYEMMQKLKLAIATSGTITLELALHMVPTIITYAIKPLDLFIVRNILKISLPHYCLVNIIANEEVFKENFGPNLTLDNLSVQLNKLLDKENYAKCLQDCQRVKDILGNKNASKEAAKLVIEQF